MSNTFLFWEWKAASNQTRMKNKLNLDEEDEECGSFVEGKNILTIKSKFDLKSINIPALWNHI